MGVPFVHDVKLSELKIRFVATVFGHEQSIW